MKETVKSLPTLIPSWSGRGPVCGMLSSCRRPFGRRARVAPYRRMFHRNPDTVKFSLDLTKVRQFAAERRLGAAGKPGRACARPDPSQEGVQHGRECQQAFRDVQRHLHRDRSLGLHLRASQDCDAPRARKGAVYVPRCGLTAARGSIGPVAPGRPGSAGIGLAWAPRSAGSSWGLAWALRGRTPDVHRFARGMAAARRFLRGRWADLRFSCVGSPA